jgi:hypothetical protein
MSTTLFFLDRAKIQARMRAAVPIMWRATKAAPPVLWRFTKSAAKLCGATALMGAGGGVAIFAFVQARQPDAVLLSAAIEAARPVAPPSANDERDLFLGLLIFGVVLAVVGVGAVRSWCKTLLK